MIRDKIPTTRRTALKLTGGALAGLGTIGTASAAGVTADFNINPSLVAGQPVVLDATPSSSTNGQITDYQWTYIHDGENRLGGDFQQMITKTFPEPGEWQIDLIVTDETGSDNWESRTVTVANNTGPTAAFSIDPSPVTVDQEVTLNATASTDSDGQVTDYQWTYIHDGENRLGGDFQKQVAKTFPEPGEWQIDLIVTDDYGDTNWRSKTITVRQ